MLHQQGKLVEASDIYQELLKENPNNYDALHFLGIVKASFGQPTEARELIERSLKATRKNTAYIENYLAVLFQIGDYERMAEISAIAIRENGRTEPFQYALAVALLKLGRPQDAITEFDSLLSKNPNHLAGNNEKASALAELKKYDEALSYVEKALKINPRYPDGLINKANILFEQGRFEAAVVAYQQALKINPKLSTAWFGSGNAFRDLGKYDDAIAAYDKAISLNKQYAQAYFNKALVSLCVGNYEEGWRLFEWRWQNRYLKPYKKQFSQPLWLGEELLAGKTILLHAEQGLGDTIQFCRYAKLVAELGAKVILEVPKALTNLLANLSGVARITEEGSQLPPFDFQCPLMSLPLAFKTTLSNVPADVPYIKSDEEKSNFWKEKLSQKRKLRVGLVWSGGFRPNQPEVWAVNRRRNIPLAKLTVLMHPGIEFYSLQKGEPAETELGDLKRNHQPGAEIIDFTNLLADFSDTAALIDNLDLVISVDTSTAHLAGAMGKPVWILNRFDTDWRWLSDKIDNPWYPTARLYRQQKVGDWDEVAQRVKTDLMNLI